ncbi:hypothetical protein L226DRAFT_566378 [Lentinus tigrinus ALCF2SS1-7]|uniref:uncharacterized protein n=1 Tax=Lentinus tigrinus ALCF2SS1-7 TaxID=1328758 RepID=UPI001165ECE8|nr:hypothetical protein L226DRAFT_566378 [Lentinus tigrinus ALCF2SS1-7]
MAPENPASSVASRTVWQVASWEHNCMLGRPLWNALHESGHDFDAILREAKTLLLGVAPEDLAVPPAGGACLATIEQCISHRIAFAIIPPYTRNLREYEATFLERHGGVCLDMNLDPRVLKVGAPSEPILSIAASNLIHKDGLDPSLALLRTLRSMLSARPHSATLVAENLILDSMFYADRTRWPSQCSDNRFVPPVVSVVNLLKSFLAHPEDALRSGPSELGLTGSPRSTFAAEFSESYIYLTHFVTVTDPMSILSHDYMLRAMSRGAGIVVTYPDSFENVAFEGATIFIPFLYKTTELLPYSLSAIAVRVTDSIPDFPTTSQTYHEEMLGRMEDRMLSFVGGVVGVPGPASPIIRILMSFSDPQSGPGYHVVHPSGDTQVEGPMPLLDSYDIWCQGLSPSLYRSVSDGQVERYRRVLEFQCWARKDWDITKQRDPCSPFRPWMDPITASHRVDTNKLGLNQDAFYRLYYWGAVVKVNTGTSNFRQ